MPALALTDHHGLAGAVEFSLACRQAGLQPLLGLAATVQPAPELPAGPPGTLLLLAMDLTGWGSLCRISSALAGAEDALSFEQLAQHAAGLLCLTGGRRGTLNYLLAAGQRRAGEALLAQLAAIFEDRLYVELQNHTAGDEELCSSLSTLAHRLGLLSVATHGIRTYQPTRLICSGWQPPSACSAHSMTCRLEHAHQATSPRRRNGHPFCRFPPRWNAAGDRGAAG
jgi:DNA polymerase-3 subunit alpha